MQDAGLVVIGSGPAGVSAATAYREAGGRGPVRLVTADQDLPYERPPLSKDVLRGEAGAEETFLNDPGFYRDHDIEIVLASPVAALLPDESAIRFEDGRTIAYDSCVLATGSKPIRPNLPGADSAHVLRSRRDAMGLADAAARATTAVVAGSGFIGCEAAASLAARGIGVTLVTEEARPQEARLGAWAGDRIAAWLREAGVELVGADRLAEIMAGSVRTEGGARYPADLVLLATGVKPMAGLAEGAGLAMQDGRVLVTADLRTSVPSVLAAGDVAYAVNASAGRAISVEHWGDALAMGEIAGRVAAGESAEWDQAPGFWSTIGDRTLKYAAWGDGYDDVRVDADDEGFTVRYGRDGELVGVLTHERDADYESGQSDVQARAPW